MTTSGKEFSSSKFEAVSKLIGILLFTTALGLGCAKDKKSSSTPPPPPPPPPAAPAPAPTPTHACVPGAPGCATPVPQQQPPTFPSAQGTLGVPPQTLPNGGYQYGAGVCPPGQIYSYYGCVVTTGCPANQGMYNNQCIPAMTIGANGIPNGLSNQNGNWGYYYNTYPTSAYYYNTTPGGGYYPYYYYTQYPYNSNLGFGISAWIR